MFDLIYLLAAALTLISIADEAEEEDEDEDEDESGGVETDAHMDKDSEIDAIIPKSFDEKHGKKKRTSGTVISANNLKKLAVEEAGDDDDGDGEAVVNLLAFKEDDEVPGLMASMLEFVYPKMIDTDDNGQQLPESVVTVTYPMRLYGAVAICMLHWLKGANNGCIYLCSVFCFV